MSHLSAAIFHGGSKMLVRMHTRTLSLISLVFVLFVSQALGAPPTWEELQAAYSYDIELALDPQVKPAPSSDTVIVEDVSFLSVNEERVPAMLYRPRGVEKPPVMLFLHGLGGNRSNVALAASMLCPSGIAALSIDAQWHGSRAKKDKAIFSQDFAQTVEGFRQTIIDNRRAIDYIVSREDLDGERIVLCGVSMGAIMGSLVAAVEPRVDSALLIVGGGDLGELFAKSQIDVAKEVRKSIGDFSAVKDILAWVDPVNFAGHIAPRPVYMLNGHNDQIVLPACGQALYDALQTPKSIMWYDSETNSGHFPPTTILVATIQHFLVDSGLVKSNNDN